MQKFILNLLVVASFALLLPACSKKTTAANSDEVTEQTKQQRQGNQPRGERPQFANLLAQMDSNKDGKISIAEAQGRLKDNFSRIDENNDGFITEAEFKNAPPPPPRGRN